jgi:hypothetical protein
MIDGLIRWLDGNLIRAGVALLAVGFLFTVVDGVRSALPDALSGLQGTGSDVSVSPLGAMVIVVSSFAYPLAYHSVWLIGLGLLLKHWRVTIVGFEDAKTSDLKVDGPDADKTVWIGRTYANEIDARLAFDALSKRIRPLP